MTGNGKNMIRCMAAICLAGLSLCCCGHSANRMAVTNRTDTVFTLPEIPKELTEPCKRADYLAMHYWDSLNPALLRSAEDSVTVEQAFVDFLSIIPLTDTSVSDKAVEKLLDGLQPERDAYGYFMELAYKYLYDADSPMENEEMLVPYLQYAADSARADNYIRMRARYLLELVLKNRPGTKAVDFRFFTRDNREGTLWSITAAQTLVIFYDPECPHCMEIMGQVTANRKISEMALSGNLKILAVYTEGQAEVWEKHKTELPAGWIVARDIDGINDNRVYDLKAMPMLYLLDKEKNVMIKNMNAGEFGD